MSWRAWERPIALARVTCVPGGSARDDGRMCVYYQRGETCVDAGFHGRCEVCVLACQLHSIALRWMRFDWRAAQRLLPECTG